MSVGPCKPIIFISDTVVLPQTVCSPPCLTGICLANGTCQCPPAYTGLACELRGKPCDMSCAKY